jgi:hypothetical protein
MLPLGQHWADETAVYWLPHILAAQPYYHPSSAIEEVSFTHLQAISHRGSVESIGRISALIRTLRDEREGKD